MKAIFLLALLIAPISVLAQSNATDSAVDGYVRDASGAPVGGAEVSARNTSTNVSASTKTDDAGYYRFPILKIGPYEIAAKSPGFKTTSQSGLNLSVGEVARADIRMELGAVTESIEVRSEASPITDTGAAATGAVLSRKEVESLPDPSRNIYNLHLLSPGVQGLTSNTFATTQFTFGGTQRSYWTVDGLDNTQKSGYRQLRMVITTPEAVDEMQVLANGYGAEFGRAAGGQVNVILKSGTNAYHGSALFSYRLSSWQARPSLAAHNPERTWHDEAFTLGGPIVKDRLFFFGQFESNPYTLPTPITITPANAAALNLPPSQTGNSPFGEQYRTIVGKVNYVLNEKNSGYVRYSRFTNHQPVNGGGLTITNRGNNYDDHMNSGGVQLATAMTPNLVNELRGGVIQRATAATVADPLPGAINAFINISGIANIGYNSLSGSSTNEQTDQVLDNLTWTHGRSTWKFGVDVEQTNLDNLLALNRQFTFGGLPASGGRGAVSSLRQYQNTVAGIVDPASKKPYTYTQYTASFGDPRILQRFRFANFFAQNELRVTPNLTLNLGVRYEAIFFPVFNADSPYPLSRRINNDPGDWAPRFAFTWSPFGNRKTTVRGAYGLYYDVPPLIVFYNAAQQNGKTFSSYTVPGSAANAPVFPDTPDLSGSAYRTPANINAFATGYHNTYQQQANLQIQRDLSKGFLLTAGYNYAALRHGLSSRNINLGAPVSYLADGRPVFNSLKPDPRFNQINLIEYGVDSNYNALFVNLRKRLSAGLQFAATYSYSHALSYALGEGSAPEDPTNLARDYGNSDNDTRHYFVAHGVYEPRFHLGALRWLNGFMLSSSANYISGFPINATAGSDLNGDGILNDRPLYRSRNDVRGPAIFQMDARLSRSFSLWDRYRLTGMLESENVLNSTNAACSTASGCSSAVVSTATASDFGRILSARTARNVQLGVRLTF